MRFRDLSPERRPREKAVSEGLSSLSDEELLALLLGKGTNGRNAVEVAHELLDSFGGLKRMGSRPWRSYEGTPGVGMAKALSLGALCELSRRIALPDLGPKPKLDGESLFKRYHALFGGDPRERLALLELDRQGFLIKEELMYEGTASGVTLNPAEIVKELAQSGAASFYLIHNHPSGIAAPSEKETAATYRLKEECRKLDIVMRDHLIIGATGYFSFLEGH
ncbi:MAG: DNA repair protein RadC [Bacilli bacterium]|jgi:DNA repair protein RadC|nr:DNA repair protein RadC [Bacilli bacterium]